MLHMARKWGRTGLRRGAPRSRAGKLALLALGLAVMGFVCARLVILLADVRPYLGWYWLVAVVAGIVAAAALYWAVVAGYRRSARWAGWLLVGYTMALVGGMRYYLGLRFTPPSSVPAALPPPPVWLVLEIAGLAAVAVSMVAVTLLLLAATAEVIVPGSIGRRIPARWRRRADATGQPGPVDQRIPARLRLAAPDGRAGRWLRGTIHVQPGSLLWEPARGVNAAAVELTSASPVLEGAGRHVKSGRAVTLDTPTGRVQVEFGAEAFTALQHIVADLANAPQPHRPPTSATIETSF